MDAFVGWRAAPARRMAAIHDPRMKRLFVLYAALAAAAAAWTVWWFAAAARVEAVVDAKADELRSGGAALSWGGRRTTGYPYRVAVEFSEPEAAWAAGGAEWRWRGDRVVGYVEPWDPRHIIVVVHGENLVERTRDGRTDAWTVEARGARASLVLDESWRPLRALVDISKIGAAPLGGDNWAYARKALLAARRSEAAAGGVDAAVTVEDARLPRDAAGPFKRWVALASARATATGPAPAAWTAAELARWRDGGGAVEITALEVEWDRLLLRGAGRLGLDAALRPEGEIDARIAGVPALADLLARRGIIDPDAARGLSLAAELLAEAPADGGPPAVPMPVAARGGALSLGPVPVAPLGPLAGPTPDAPRRPRGGPPASR